MAKKILYLNGGYIIGECQKCRKAGRVLNEHTPVGKKKGKRLYCNECLNDVLEETIKQNLSGNKDERKN